MVARCHMFVVCFFGFIFQSGSEPVCTSRFDYDVRLLESYLELKQSYRQLTETVDQLTSSLQTLQDLTSKGTGNNPAGMKVAFYVLLTNDLTNLGNHQTLIFDKVTTNIGNGYNPIDGVFTAPVGGTYVFSWTNTNKDKSYMNTELIKNKELFGKAMSDAMDHSDYAVASNTAALQVETGDKIWIRSGTWHSNKVAGQLYTTFSGWKLSGSRTFQLMGEGERRLKMTYILVGSVGMLLRKKI